MRIVTLLPQSKRAKQIIKQIIKQHGERWEVLDMRDRFFSQTAPGRCGHAITLGSLNDS